MSKPLGYKCEDCDGTGTIKHVGHGAFGESEVSYNRCGSCGGTGVDYKRAYEDLKSSCKKLLDDANKRHEDKEPLEWQCPHMQKICDIIDYKFKRKNPPKKLKLTKPFEGEGI